MSDTTPDTPASPNTAQSSPDSSGLVAPRARSKHASSKPGHSAGTPKSHPSVWRPIFLAAYRNSGNMRAAQQACGTPRDTIKHNIDRDPAFAAKVEEAYEESCDAIEAEIRRRAFAGSDRLLEFMAKAAMPAKYGDRVKVDIAEHTRKLALEAGLSPEETEEAVIEAQAILRERREENRRKV